MPLDPSVQYVPRYYFIRAWLNTVYPPENSLAKTFHRPIAHEALVFERKFYPHLAHYVGVIVWITTNLSNWICPLKHLLLDKTMRFMDISYQTSLGAWLDTVNKGPEVLLT